MLMTEMDGKAMIDNLYQRHRSTDPTRKRLTPLYPARHPIRQRTTNNASAEALAEPWARPFWRICCRKGLRRSVWAILSQLPEVFDDPGGIRGIGTETAVRTFDVNYRFAHWGHRLLSVLV